MCAQSMLSKILWGAALSRHEISASDCRRQQQSNSRSGRGTILIMKFRAIFLFAVCLFTSTAALAASAEFNSIAKQGASVGESGLGDLNAKEELGVDASGSIRNGGQGVEVDYSQSLTGPLQCPSEPGETGKYANILQFVAACETISGAEKSVFICIPNDPTDSADRDCSNGNWRVQTLNATTNAWRTYQTGLKARLAACDGEGCDIEIHKEASFSGGESEANDQGNSAINSAQGSTQIVRDQGAYLPDGSVMQSGSNENSGEYVSELTAAGSVAACADDVQTSIDNGTPVFTCDGSGDVGMVGESENICEDIETCVEWSTTTREFEKTCEASVTYDGADCDVVYEQEFCQLSNAKVTEECTTQSDPLLVAELDQRYACDNYSVQGSGNIQSKTVNVDPFYQGRSVFVGFGTHKPGSNCLYCMPTTVDRQSWTGTWQWSSITLQSQYVYPRARAWMSFGPVNWHQTWFNELVSSSSQGVICLQEDQPDLDHIPAGYDYQMFFSTPYDDSRPSGRYVEKSEYTQVVEAGFYFSSYDLELKPEYKDLGYELFMHFRDPPPGEYLREVSYIIYENRQTRSCEPVT